MAQVEPPVPGPTRTIFTAGSSSKNRYRTFVGILSESIISHHLPRDRHLLNKTVLEGPHSFTLNPLMYEELRPWLK